ncbi:transcriptional regulator [Terrihabitans soli]|uniref:Transcriptional regulator n=1 Tax=Terrihabitans soli TaxID=708113 RepID=A0A6S6QLD0_9HYPH|nr:helix-turn-helix domain-containing protein [Terrihabitans soli]BCJ89679.1 transcriptional regulator [Terrihabitans soli]
MISLTATSRPLAAGGPPPGIKMVHAELPFVGSIPGEIVEFEADSEIHIEGDKAVYAYRVLSGAVRTFSLLADGRRQIESFHFAGDVFGIDIGDVYRLSAEACCDTRLLVIKRAQIEAASRKDCGAARELWCWTAQALERARVQMLLLGRKSALEKVASFLVDMARERHEDGVLELPMCRTDIADYLGLTIETVSRSLSHLERAGAIALPATRRIELRNKQKLGALALQS